MRYFTLLVILFCFSCDNERVLHLPEIGNTEITEVLDVSPAYLFYDETQPDSTLLNRKNLISTTNWLVNVDKRLTLKQAIPHIKFLQDKKRNAKMHKNEDAKNYFTCNDTSVSNLGFIEFTSIDFIIDETPESFYKNISQLYENRKFIHPKIINVESFHGNILMAEIIHGSGIELSLKMIRYSEFPKYLESYYSESLKEYLEVILSFDKNLSFQDYISIKSELKKIKSDKIIIDTNEFIY
ncbi:hypothetical protein FBALC1_04082 [Flavobacteriales bacterium ALC-1]|nr:hypothetical protein FBALC1_04082 [Flavobacteriales bacterium ALC-1]